MGSDTTNVAKCCGKRSKSQFVTENGKGRDMSREKAKSRYHDDRGKQMSP